MGGRRLCASGYIFKYDLITDVSDQGGEWLKMTR